MIWQLRNSLKRDDIIKTLKYKIFFRLQEMQEKVCLNPVVSGDINIYLSKKGKCIQDILHIQGMQNTIKEALMLR